MVQSAPERLYAATHLSAPGYGQLAYSPWADWKDEDQSFPHSTLLAWDTNKDEVAWSSVFIPREGCRCLALDEERGIVFCPTGSASFDVTFGYTGDYSAAGHGLEPGRPVRREGLVQVAGPCAEQQPQPPVLQLYAYRLVHGEAQAEFGHHVAGGKDGRRWGGHG